MGDGASTGARRRSTRLTLVAALLFAILAYAGGGVAGAKDVPSLDCGTREITSDVRLREDLACPDGFYTSGSNVGRFHVDLGGHTLTVPHVLPRCKFTFPNGYLDCYALFGFASVSNGTVDGWMSRIDHITHVELRGSVFLHDNDLIEHSTVIGGRVVVYSYDVTVRDNRLERASIVFDDTDWGLGNTSITGNRISDAPGPGIDVLTIFICIYRTPDGTLTACADVTGVIAHNTVTGSQGPGILVHGALFSLGALEIRDNTLQDNSGDGIRVDLSPIYSPPGLVGPILLEGNHATGNGGHGVNADQPTNLDPAKGVQDGGHNQARGNALDPQCVGVAC